MAVSLRRRRPGDCLCLWREVVTGIRTADAEDVYHRDGSCKRLSIIASATNFADGDRVCGMDRDWCGRNCRFGCPVHGRVRRPYSNPLHSPHLRRRDWTEVRIGKLTEHPNSIRRTKNMTKIALFLSLTLGVATMIGPAKAGTGTASSLITKDLPDVPGKEGMVELVNFAPGEVSERHRHNADLFVYVLEGS